MRVIGGANTIWFDRHAARWDVRDARWEHGRSLGEIGRLRGLWLRSGVCEQLMMADLRGWGLKRRGW